ncbi:hypothetical protein GCM10007979_36680 [Nocardioides albus]|nr:hypothetical protein GCM10007979_36680 [Nocardioides albus]
MGAAAGRDTPRAASLAGGVGQRGGKPPDPRQGGQVPDWVTLRPRDTGQRFGTGLSDKVSDNSPAPEAHDHGHNETEHRSM